VPQSAANEVAIETLLTTMYGGSVAKEKVKSKWDDVPEPSEELLVGFYDFKVTGVKVTKTTKEPERKMFIAELMVTKPAAAKGQTHAEFFVVGTEDDPEAEDADTLKGSPGAKAFKAFCTAAGVQMVDDDDELCELLKGETVSGNVTAPTKEGGRKGVRSNAWFPVGEKDPEITEVVKKATAKKATKKVADVDEDEEEEKPAKKKRPVDDDEDEPAPKKKAAKKPADDDDADDEEDEETERPKSKRKPSRDDEDEDSDDDSDEDEDERPKRGKRR
jgi:hypothetical protein